MEKVYTKTLLSRLIIRSSSFYSLFRSSSFSPSSNLHLSTSYSYWDGEVRDDSCILCCYQKEAKRMHQPEYTPKWVNKVSVTQKKDQVYMYPSCTANNKLIASSFVPINEVKAALQVQSDSEGSKTVFQALPRNIPFNFPTLC